MSALTIALLLSAVVLVLAGGRRVALLTLIAASIVFTRGQYLLIGGLSFYPTRLLMLAAFARVAMRGDLTMIRWNSLDRIVLMAYAFCVAMFVLRAIMGHGTIGVAQVSVADRIGTLADVALAYIAIRALLRQHDDLVWLFSALVFLLIPYVGMLVVERVTGQNPFSAIGAFEHIWSEPERLRCRGTFLHPSLLGSFGASLIPVYCGMYFSGNRRFVAIVGFACSLAIVALANSGGPWIFAMATFAAWGLWPARQHMREIRYGILTMFIMLAILMKAPIWYLPAKLSEFSGGDGWHRSYLMDQAIRHLGEWWLAGMPLQEATEWFPYLARGGLDITNLFVAFGLDSGLFGMALLVAVFVVAYSRIGCRLHRQRLEAAAANPESLICWGLGACLTGHLVNFFAITYFDQTYVIWLLLLAGIASVTSTDVCTTVHQSLHRFSAKRKARKTIGQVRKPSSAARRSLVSKARNAGSSPDSVK